MKAGDLKEEIEIHNMKSVTDIYGGDSTTYEYAYNTKASIYVNKTEREILNYGVMYGSVITIRVRYYHNINVTDLIVWESNKYRILSVFKDKQQKHIEVKAELIKE